MNNEDITRQITKFKARRLKSRLANYSTLTSTLLALSVFSRGLTSSTLLTFLLVLPLPLYFALQSFKLYHKTIKSKAHLAFLQSSIANLGSQFSFGKFISQPNLAFRLSLVLFFLVLFTTLARLRAPDPTLTESTNYQVLSTTN